MKNILVKAYLVKNFGDDLFLKVLFDRYNKTNWIIDTNDKEYKEIFNKYNNVNIIKSSFFKILRKLNLHNIYYRKYDAVIYIGGSIFMQLDIWKKQYKEKVILFNLFKDKPKYILGANFGPFKDKVFFEKHRELFNKCKDICFRDEYSYDLFKDLENVRMAPDIVFQVKPTYVDKIKNSIGISLINLKNRDKLSEYNDKYKNKIKEVVEELIDNGKLITFFSFCEEEGDKEVIEEILDIIDDNYKGLINIENYNGNIDEFLSKFERMENIIGTRFHACILSQVFSQGLYPLIYSDKTYNVLSDIGLDKEYLYIKNIEELSSKRILKVINDNKIQDRKICIEAEKHFEVLDNYINS
ncbi:polysaccharide pyruvyl transferase family protein [Clostridium sp.]|uniref:polysaccharide pyruvyl transferase family protein n=1 Tax=Clostridium sp. TaxID=1506 RepID=UPI001DD97707|nr:polysaccharide pyruvyl transferase family protein [Clostridium sp.]MBS5938009.1 polysaccharide pyruvyl transferase family protein [Clostridium sp.]